MFESIAVVAGSKLLLAVVLVVGLMALVIAAPVAMAADVASRGIPGPRDAALVLQAAVTKTADFNGAGILPFGAGFSPGNIGKAVAGVIEVTALDLASTDETYDFVLQESDDDSTYVACGTAKSVTATGVWVVKGIQSKPYVRLAPDVGGTTPSITYSATFNPNT